MTGICSPYLIGLDIIEYLVLYGCKQVGAKRMGNGEICTFCPERKEYFLNDLFCSFPYFETVIYKCI